MRESIGSLSNEEFETFVLTEEEYGRIKVNDHEVKIDGKMYDHSKPKIKEGNVTLYARHDKAEDKLISLLSEVVNIATQDDKPVPLQLLSFLSLTFVPHCTLNIIISRKEEMIFYPYSARLVNEISSVESPPPKV